MDAEEVLRKVWQELDVPEEFSFPFPPYPIQKEFMTRLYSALERKQLGIFESPTGTGKSLSVICGCLAWLRDHEEREKRSLVAAVESLSLGSDEATDWIQAQAEGLRNRHVQAELRRSLDRISKRQDTISQIRERISKQETKKKQFNKKEKKMDDLDGVGKESQEADIILEDVTEEMEQSEHSDEEDKEETDNGVKIIFCSRTHSQLSQFVNEIRKTSFRADVRVVPLSSRQNYCINKGVSSLNSISLINERCLDMQRKGRGKATVEGANGEKVKRRKAGDGPCPMMSGVARLGEEVGVGISDLEDLVAAGQETKTCPYYASRSAASLAQLVVVPYNMLLHKGTREASGLSLEGNVVIIDEAHNLLETITNIHSSQLSGTQVCHAYNQVCQYKERYKKRFSPLNLLYLNQLVYIMRNIIKLLGGKQGCGPSEASSKAVGSVIQTLTDFQLTADIDNFNIFDIVRFCKLSKITHKMHGFSKYVPLVKVQSKPSTPSSGVKSFLQRITKKQPTPAPQTEEQEEVTVEGNPLLSVVSFLECLMNSSRDGRVVTSRSTTVGASYVKYLLLNPAPTFKDIVDKARSVIVCGGTMEPVSEFREQLFKACGASADRIVEFRCGHVIPPENILPMAVSSGPTGKLLDFSFQSRKDPATLSELGRIMSSTCKMVPGGVVCFFPSYEYEATVFQFLEKTGVIATLSQKKKVFREPKKSSQVEIILAEYAAIIKKATRSSEITGCLLFSVVGGKLSEGLNFSDDLGRCVMVVGLPYPNIKSPELVEKMAYLDSNVGSGAGRSYYEAVCMKGVNQCIGRAVRHQGDYSSVLLLDSRYLRPGVQAQLPAWIRRSLTSHTKFGPSVALLAKFFKQHQ